LSLVLTLFIGVLNGLEKFTYQNFSSVVSALLKVGFAVLFVFIGYGVNGALWGIILGLVAGIVICYVPLNSLVREANYEKFDSKPIYRYAVPVFFASMFSIFVVTVDQILVKHFFSSVDAGLYAAAGNVGKIIWFGSGFLTSVLFPQIVALKAQKKDTSKLLMKVLLISGLLAVIGCVVYFSTPNLIVNLLYGSDYLSIAPLIGLFGVGMMFFSLLQVMITYNLAMEKYNFIYIILLGLIIEVAGIFVFHESLLDIVKIFLVSNALMLFGVLVYNLKDFFENGI
jgi:O-antigen/teichoic acid export membrane protein